MSQRFHLEVLLLSKSGSERGISIDADSGPLGHALCKSKSQDFFTFIQIGSGHTVVVNKKILQKNLLFIIKRSFKSKAATCTVCILFQRFS